VRIGSKFNGPPDSAHGGVACGVFAGVVDARRATVRLSAPPPLDEDLRIDDHPDGSRSIAGAAGPVASVRVWDVPIDLDPLPLLDAEQLATGARAWLSDVAPDHPFPTCFGCGHARPERDGLELFPGEIPGSPFRGAAWTPTGADEDAEVPDWLVWAAVDCPSGAATMPWADDDQVVLLGQMSLEIRRRPAVGEHYQVVARAGGRDGRKLRSDVAVVASDGANVARGRCLWILVDRAG
jgi:hypothetical protein